MASTHNPAKFEELIRLIDEAVLSEDGKVCCHKVKDALEYIVRSGEDFLLPEHMAPAQGRYARHLVHLDPQGRYSMLAMVWDKGQGTPVHDHAGMWCCECVYRGRIKVDSYRMEGNDETDETVKFHLEQTIFAGPGEAGALIPPFDHHTIENDIETPSVTIHIYGGEMTWCHVFVPEGDGFKRVYRELAYTSG